MQVTEYLKKHRQRHLDELKDFLRIPSVSAKSEHRGDMERAAEAVLELGAGAVLVKGGHLEERAAADLFVDGGRTEWLETERIDTPHTHGTGCVLSAAIAAYLARGEELLEAVRKGKRFVTEAIRGGLPLGQGIGPANPAWGLAPSPEQ